MTEIRITVTNTSPVGGTFLTPVWFGFHDNSFDLFETGEAASAGLEAIAEDGNVAPLGAELLAADADGQGGVVAGAAGPIATQEQTSTIVDVDGASNGYVSLAAMLLPSNDAFIGTNDAAQLFDADGNFLGAQQLTFLGTDVYDAGTEVNTELDAAFINQTAPDTGLDEGGVVGLHPGFNGSLGNPVGEGDQIILGGTNAFGELIDPEAADFTRPGATVASVHINTVNREDGGDGRDTLIGAADDDFFNGGGGRDVLFGGAGYDVLDGGAGRDLLIGGGGSDILEGAGGFDTLLGGGGSDSLSGGNGRDLLIGGAGDDFIFGGRGLDQVVLGSGDDTVAFGEGDGRDEIFAFDAGDLLVLGVEGVASFEDLLGVADQKGADVLIRFGGGDKIILADTQLDTLQASQFDFLA